LKSVDVIIIGFGVIGRGVARIIMEKRDFLRKMNGFDLRVVAICEINGSIISENGVDLNNALLLSERGRLEKHRDWNSMKSFDVIDKIDADIVLELTPGDIKNGEPGFSHIKESLKRKMNVVTSNKAPIALNFKELQKIANKNDVKLRYEATVGGAIPIINLHQKCLQINETRSIYGILNGTTNYILSKMTEEDMNFDDALNEANELGIAESNPSYDIDGVDTALKVAILANSVMDKDVRFKDIKIQGIRDITQEAIELAKKHGYVIKLIGDVGRLEVSPRLIPVEHPLNVSGSLNAIMMDTDIAGEITIVGHGAGAKETASSIFSDIIDISDSLSLSPSCP